MLETWSDEFGRISLFWIDKWGDGIVKLPLQVLQWDDGNTENGDGCSSVCTIEDKYEWEVMTSIHNKSYWRQKWGNGKWVTADSETWDDANNTNGDGWSNTWAIELGFKYINTPNDKSFWYPNWVEKIRDTIESQKNTFIINDISRLYVYFQRVVQGPISNSLYHWYFSNNNGMNSIVRRVNADGSEAWMFAKTGGLFYQSLAVKSKEQYLYYGTEYSLHCIVKLPANNGELAEAKSL